jgi:CheY-like chemotaxis protein
MLLNLLFNAVKFTNSGSVGLKVTTKDLYLRFTIWDTGIGISPENQTLLFRPYSQIINSQAASNEGIGLGLVVTQQLAEIHGGYLELESKVNSGSNFTLILPLQLMGKILESIEIKANKDVEFSKQASNYPGYLSPIVMSENFSQEILLVEDDIANAELIMIYLRRLGYQVTCVKDAQEMWINLSKLEPAVILMDVKLPDGNGLELVKQLREIPQYQQIPIIAQTAMAMKGDRETCLAAGVNEYISKPIDLQFLATTLAQYCH